MYWVIYMYSYISHDVALLVMSVCTCDNSMDNAFCFISSQVLYMINSTLAYICSIVRYI
jgi:hypothetical protein